MLENINFFNYRKKNLNKIGLKLFYIGVLLLPTAPSIAAFILIISLIFSSNNNPINFIKERTNKVFLIVSILMILSCIYNNFYNINFINENVDYLPLISLINWIPFFWMFWGFQPYLEKFKERRIIAKLLVIGTIPVIFSGFSQYFFDINGPFQIFNGLIIWYQRPLSITDGLTGPFNNANYAGSWLAIVWPFSIYFFCSNKKISRKFITSIICLIFVFSLLLTNSRNSWIGMFISVQIIFGFETMFIIIPLLILFLFILSLLVSNIPASVRETIITFFPINIFNNFPDNSLSLFEAYPRMEIWKFSIENILKRPLLGWGGGSFPIIYKTLQGKWIGHPHNIIFELAFNYGLLTAVIMSSKVFQYLCKFYKFIAQKTKLKISIGEQNLYFEKAWFSSVFFITYSHLFDIQYFDLRISIMSWILLSGLRAAMI